MEVYFNNQTIQVYVIRKKIKNIYFRFDNDMNLVVSANKYISEKEIKKLIEQNKSSLEKMFKKVENKRQKDQEFWYLGNSYQVYIEENANTVSFDTGVVTCRNEEMLNRFIKNQTKEILKREVDYLKNIIQPPEFILKIRKMKTRWGVCNYKSKTITLNSELIRYRIDDLRYVIVHEMCHFWYHDHSKEFWNMVSRYYPNYKEARKDLRC